jgi:predicted secreted protein
MSQKIGHGAQLKYNSTGTTFVVVPGVTQAGFSSSKTDVVENTDFGTAGNAKTFIGGMFDPGDFSAKINVVPGDADQAAVRDWLGDGVNHKFQFIDSSGIETAAFDAIVVSMDEDTQLDKIATYSLKLKVTGPVVYTVAP